MGGRSPVPRGTIVQALPDERCVALDHLAVHIIDLHSSQERRGVDEFWVCQHCRSLNRAGTGRCYHCRQKFGSAPKAAAPVNRSAAAPGPRPVSSGQADVDALPSYLVRPIALETAVPSDNSIGGSRESHRRLHRPHVTDPIRRRISWALATRQSVSISGLGYVTAAMLSLVLLDGLLLVSNGLPTAFNALQSGSPKTAWDQLGTPQQGTLQVLAIAFVAIGAVTLLCFSVFVGVTTHNAPGLGAQTPPLTPYRAGIGWLRGLLAQVQVAFGLLAPATLVLLGYTIPGLILGIVVLEIVQRRLDDPFGWLARPSRQLSDLYLSLGVDGAPSAPLITIWSACFVALNVLINATFALPLVGVIASAASTLTHQPNLVTWQASGYSPTQTGIALLVGSLLVSAAATIGLLIPITLGLVARQRTRQTLARVGRARPWAMRPDAGTSATRPVSKLYDPYDRPDDHASLYSPSTTSSPGWSEGASEEPPA